MCVYVVNMLAIQWNKIGMQIKNSTENFAAYLTLLLFGNLVSLCLYYVF